MGFDRVGFDLKGFDRPVLSPQVAKLIVTVLNDLGVAPDDLFARVNFNESALGQAEAFLSFNQMFDLIDVALRLSPIPWLGLKVGDSETVSTWGVLGYAIMSSANEIEASAIGTKYTQAAPSLMDTQTSVQDGRQRIVMDPIYPIARLTPFCVEENAMGIIRVASEYLQEPLKACEIHLSYSKPIYARKYEQYFDCPIHYDQPQNIMWTKAPKDRPLKTSDAASAQICLKLAEQMVARHRGEDSFLQRVRRELLRTPGSMPSMEQVSATLAMSSRTLRRNLDDLGTSFRSLQDDVKKSLATDYLTNTTLSVEQIAARLGYTEPTNFRRAFKQWTSRTPREYRLHTGKR